jgi:FAD/FMN-containing dehydrogenase
MHAGAGELHLRPVLNLKTKEGLHQFRNIATRSGYFGKKYRGSLREHGDGIVRGEFYLYDWAQNYELLKELNLPLIPTLFECR